MGKILTQSHDGSHSGRLSLSTRASSTRGGGTLGVGDKNCGHKDVLSQRGGGTRRE